MALPTADSGRAVPESAPPQDLRGPDSVPLPPAAAQLQDLRAPDRTPAGTPKQDLRAPDRTGFEGSLAPESVTVPASPAVASSASTSSSGGMDALWIVLIAVGGAMALAGTAYLTVHYMHAHRGTHILH